MTEDEVLDLIDRAYGLPAGRAQAGLLEEAVRGADLIGDLELQFNVRLEFINAAFWADEPEKLFAAVAWCLGVSDSHPQRFDLHQLLNCYEQAMACVSSMPQIPRSQIDEMFADLRRRYESLGYDMVEYYRQRCFAALWMGDLDVAREFFPRMLSAARPGNHDDYWMRLFRVDYYLQTGQRTRALEEAEPTLSASHTSRDTFPWVASFALPALVLEGRREDAARCQRRCYRDIRDNPKFIELIAHHLRYFALIGDHSGGISLLERHLIWGLESFPHREQFEFYLGAWRLCRDVAAERDTAIHIPDAFPLPEFDKQIAASQLAAWLENATRQLARQFDQRNGNQHFDSLIRGVLE